MKHHYLRKALPTDRKRYLNWMRDPALRQASFALEGKKEEGDRACFESMLEDEKCECLVYMDFFMALGEVRVRKSEKDEKTALLSWSVAEEFRGQGIGAEMLAAVKERYKDSYERFETQQAPEGEDAAQPEKKREKRFEALRVIAMLMIILMHYMEHGGLLLPLGADRSAANMGFWFLEALCLASVNVYVMISGYYAVDSRFSLRKFIRLWFEVFFYSVLVAAVCFLTGIESLESRGNLFELQYLIFPVSNGHYWFVTAYLMLTLLAPFIGAGMRRLNKLQHTYILICLLIFTGGLKSIFPEHMMGLEDHGCGLLWFLTLYVLAGYIRLYGLPFAKGRISAALLYIISAALVLPFIMVMSKFEEGIALFAKEGVEGSGLLLRFPHAPLLVDDYNHILVLLAGIGLFMLFVHVKEKEKGVFALLAKLAPYTFGVYLIHAHLYLNTDENWERFFHVGKEYGALRILHMLGVAVLIFALCAVIDALRTVLFALVERFCDWALKIYYAKKEVWDYLIAGFAATVMSWLTYVIFAVYAFAGMEETVRVLFGNAVSWTITMVFAYVVNRVFVFHSEATGFKAVSKEFLEFAAARLFSFGLEELIMFVFVTLIGWNEILVKVLIASIIVIVLNYILSKLWIFKDPKKEKKA